MNILVMDGQGGRLGAQLIKEIRARLPQSRIMAVGTNSAATAAMLKAGADESATGENPVVVACRKADVIVGPVGIVIADAMLGEITEKMACAVARADAKRILIPMNRCDNLIAGVQDLSLSTLIADAVEKLSSLGPC
ncbi:MAG: DUF3842 family protein [Oscillospiraceae bacterium]|nr:DUF3842 family protein [Oscillospiraceae bacterium]